VAHAVARTFEPPVVLRGARGYRLTEVFAPVSPSLSPESTNLREGHPARACTAAEASADAALLALIRLLARATARAMLIPAGPHIGASRGVRTTDVPHLAENVVNEAPSGSPASGEVLP